MLHTSASRVARALVHAGLHAAPRHPSWLVRALDHIAPLVHLAPLIHLAPPRPPRALVHGAPLVHAILVPHNLIQCIWSIQRLWRYW